MNRSINHRPSAIDFGVVVVFKVAMAYMNYFDTGDNYAFLDNPGSGGPP